MDIFGRTPLAALVALAACDGAIGTQDKGQADAPPVRTGGGSDAGIVAPQACTNGKPNPGLPAGAPALTVGVWTNLSPSGPPWHTNDGFGQGMALDPCNPTTIYLATCGFDYSTDGLWKSVDAGATWRQVGKVQYQGKDRLLDEPIRIRIDPTDPSHIYVGDGVRGATQGFWVSHDAGETFVMPAAFAGLQAAQGLYNYDVYDVAVDPTDFNHVLVSSHSSWGWTDTKWNANAGILESKDGGDSWIVHPPGAWGYGHSINFLYKPELGLGDSQTWLLGTQNGQRFRTTNGGASWTMSDVGIQHGGSTLYYTKAGILYSAGYPQNVRSMDNGQSWTPVSGVTSNCVFGDGQTLYTGVNFTNGPLLTSPESDGTTWTSSAADQKFTSSPFEMGFDEGNGILYASIWGDGLWALRTR